MNFLWSQLSRLTNGNGLSNILILLVFGLLLWIGVQVRPKTDVVLPKIAAAQLPPLDMQTMQLAVMPIRQYQEMIRRPIFYESRQALQSNAKKTMILGEFELTGVIITGDYRFAILKNKKTKKELSVKQGQNIQGWLVKSVNKQKVILERGNRIEEIALKVKTSETNKRLKYQRRRQ